ncbi:hypothetical protein MICRO116_50034 [Micrococcus sp. 116]|nr:hypothetical protein MICRO116_50034 [Micrococcus sp. 116]
MGPTPRDPAAPVHPGAPHGCGPGLPQGRAAPGRTPLRLLRRPRHHRGPRAAALAGRRELVGEPRGLLPALQRGEGGPLARGPGLAAAGGAGAPARGPVADPRAGAARRSVAGLPAPGGLTPEAESRPPVPGGS